MNTRKRGQPLSHSLIEHGRATDMRTLAISLINHSHPELLRDCLRSIAAALDGLDCIVYVVDNFSGLNQVPALQIEFPEVQWIFNDRRRGFAANHNQVLAVADARYICVLNDDTVLHPRSLRELVRVLESDGNIGMVGPKLLNPDGTLQDSAFNEHTLVAEAVAVTILPRKLNALKRMHVSPAQSSTDNAKVGWLLGACVTVRREAIEKVGGLDSRNFPVANNEDVDWCHRMRSAGYHLVYVPSAVVTHIGGQTVRSDDNNRVSWMQLETMRTRVVYFRKNMGTTASVLARAIHVVASIWNCGIVLQAWVRRRLTLGVLKAQLKTHFAIAYFALLPDRGPRGPFADFA